MDETVQTPVADPNPSQSAPVAEEAVATPAAATDNTAEAKPAEAAPEGNSPVSLGGDEEKPEGEQSATVPEKYEFEADITENAPGIADALGGAAKDLGLSQEQLSAFVEKMRPAFVQNQQQIIDRSAKLWEDRTLADPEIGGANLKANMAIASRAYKTFASESLRKEFAQAKLDRHPEVIRLFLNVGRTLGEDTAVRTTAAKTLDLSDPRTMYPNRKLNR